MCFYRYVFEVVYYSKCKKFELDNRFCIIFLKKVTRNYKLYNMRNCYL